MKKYSKGFMAEVARFEKCSTADGLLNRSEVGLQQFHEYESKGIKPSNPDQYFAFLCDGKKWWEWTLNFYIEQWPQNWDGWYQYARDFLDDPRGFKQLRQRAAKVFLVDDINVTPQEFINRCNVALQEKGSTP